MLILVIPDKLQRTLLHPAIQPFVKFPSRVSYMFPTHVSQRFSQLTQYILKMCYFTQNILITMKHTPNFGVHFDDVCSFPLCVVVYVLFVFGICPVCRMLSVSLDCPLLITPSVFYTTGNNGVYTITIWKPKM